MKDYQERVKVEQIELDEKIRKLSTFIDSSTYKLLDIHEQTRLIQQLEFMKSYSDVLASRIKDFV